MSELQDLNLNLRVSVLTTQSTKIDGLTPDMYALIVITYKAVSSLLPIDLKVFRQLVPENIVINLSSCVLADEEQRRIHLKISCLYDVSILFLRVI